MVLSGAQENVLVSFKIRRKNPKYNLARIIFVYISIAIMYILYILECAREHCSCGPGWRSSWWAWTKQPLPSGLFLLSAGWYPGELPYSPPLAQHSTNLGFLLEVPLCLPRPRPWSLGGWNFSLLSGPGQRHACCPAGLWVGRVWSVQCVNKSECSKPSTSEWVLLRECVPNSSLFVGSNKVGLGIQVVQSAVWYWTVIGL